MDGNFENQTEQLNFFALQLARKSDDIASLRQTLDFTPYHTIVPKELRPERI